MGARAQRFGWILLALASGCSREKPERITLGIPHAPAYALVFIAGEAGYFAAHGLTVERRRYPSGRDALAGLSAGEVEAAACSETPVVIRAGGEQLDVLTMLHSSSRNTRVVARADRGIARAEDLAGHRVGVSRNTHAEYFLHVLLLEAGLREPSVRIVDVAPEAAIDALVSGEIDAVALRPPLVARAQRMLGERRAIDLVSDTYTEISVLVVRDATQRARRPALVKLLRALADAERLVRERPEEAFQVFRREFPEVSERELRDAWGRIDPSLGVTHELAAALEQESAWFRRIGRVGAPPIDVGQLLDPELLAEVDPEAATFVAPARTSGAR